MLSRFITSLATVTPEQAAVSMVALFVTFIAWNHLEASRKRQDEPPVRWSWIPFMGFAIDMGIRPIELLKESGDLLGEIFGLVVAGNRMFIINDCHSYNIIFKPTKDMSWLEFHHSILINFFGTSKDTVHKNLLDEDLMRKWYSKYLLR